MSIFIAIADIDYDVDHYTQIISVSSDKSLVVNTAKKFTAYSYSGLNILNFIRIQTWVDNKLVSEVDL